MFIGHLDNVADRVEVGGRFIDTAALDEATGGTYPVFVFQRQDDRLPVAAVGPDGEVLSPAMFARLCRATALWQPLSRLTDGHLFATQSGSPRRGHVTVDGRRTPRWVLPVALHEARAATGLLAAGQWFIFRQTEGGSRLAAVIVDGRYTNSRAEVAQMARLWHVRHGRVDQDGGAIMPSAA